MEKQREQVLSQGLVAGLIGYATVALFFVVVDVLFGRAAFYTPALIGGALFYGLRDPSELVVWAGPVFSYNGVHLLLFLALGALAAWLARFSERAHQLWYVGLSLFLFVLLHLQGAVLMLTERVRESLSTWQVLVAGLAAGVTMCGYLLWTHPKLRREFREYREEE